jgi:hypothetical protein
MAAADNLYVNTYKHGEIANLRVENDKCNVLATDIHQFDETASFLRN